jgi:hypothetical protein
MKSIFLQLPKILVIPLFINVTIGSSLVSAAVTHIVNSNGQLIRANNVLVSGVLYDVEFKDGTFTSIFGSIGNLDATTASQATAFSTALHNQVFIDIPSLGLYFDSSPASTIYGCEPYQSESDPSLDNDCFVYTPYAKKNGTYGSNTLYLHNAAAKPDDEIDVSYTNQWPLLVDMSYQPQAVYADWSISQVVTTVPLPAAVWFMASGLVGLASIKRYGRKNGSE